MSMTKPSFERQVRSTVRNTLLWCVGSIIVAGGLVLGIVVFTLQRQEQPEPRELTRSQVVSEEDYAYILKTYEGRLAVFARGKAEPEMVFDLYVQYLPAYDQGQLGQGIYVEDYPTLVKMIEDYIS